MWNTESGRREWVWAEARRGGAGLAISLALTGCSVAPSPDPYPIFVSGGAVNGGTPGDDSGASTPTGSGDSPDAGASSGEVDQVAVLASISQGAFRDSGAFVHVTRAPYPSAAAAGSTIEEWVSSLGAAEYQRISPDGGAASAPLPPGATIVREVIDATGAVTALTLLVKGPPGYNPVIGDWWWGVTDPEGVPAVSDAGVELGRLTQCYSCHLPRSSEDFLFGAPAADKAGE